MIKFVYFDLGGVVELDFSGTNKWEELIRDLGVTSETRHIYDEIWNKYEDMLSTGFDVDRLVPIFREKLGIKKPETYSFLMDFVDRFEQNKSIWPVIGEIHKQCKVGLLTNVYPRMLDAIIKKGLLPDVDWDVVIDSSKVHLKKPDPKVYKLAEEKCSFEGNEILFVENTQKNLDVAKSIGWQTFFYDSSSLLDSSEKLLEFFKKNV